MSRRHRGELLFGIGAFVWRLLALVLAYVQPYGESNATAMNVLKFSPGFTGNQLPYILAIGLPILGITIGASAHSLTVPKACGPCSGSRLL